MATPARGELLSPSRARDQGGEAHQRAGCGSLRSSPARELLPSGWEREPPRRRGPPLPVARAHMCARDSLRTELAGGQGFAPRSQARELTGGAGRRSPRPGGGASGGGHGGQQARFWGCCKCMLHVFGMFLKNVASVSCECCKSRSRCCYVVTISDTCCMCINLDVAKVSGTAIRVPKNRRETHLLS
jgi:hypothetical protein